jgi:hypothetical protein
MFFRAINDDGNYFPNLSLKIGQTRYLNLMKGKNFNKDNLNILSQIIFMEAIH